MGEIGKKKKVLFVIESFSGGGAERVLCTILQHIDRKKFETIVCPIVDTGVYSQTVRDVVDCYKPIVKRKQNLWGKLYARILYKLVYYWLPLSLVYKLFVPKNNDVEIAFVEGFATKLLSFSSNKKSKKIAWVHIDFKRFHWTKSVYKSDDEERNVYARFEKIITVSKTAESSFVDTFPEFKDCVETLYNPINSDYIMQESQKAIGTIGKKDEGIVRLVSVGRLAPQKKYDRLLRIIKRLKEDGFPCELWLLGDGEMRKELENYVHTNHMEKNVMLLGFQKNPYQYLVHCDLFVCSSVSEGYSTAVTEALILGLPVVTTDCSGMKELLNDGEVGLITDNSEEALFEGVKYMLYDNRYKSYTSKAAEKGKQFSLNNLMRPIENILYL